MFTDLLQETSPLGAADRNAYYVQTANHVAPSEPECDGRGVLIVSTVRLMSEDVPSELTKALEATPGAEFTYPGQCASLRTREGIDALYPVYLDFGDDIEGLCAAVDKHPGANARLLTNENDYGTPCPAR